MSNRRYFGTDGIRGAVNSLPLTAETAMRVGLAAGRHFRRGEHKHRVIIGKDTRLSGYMLEPALVAGFVSVGMNVITVGPMPTPAVALLVKSFRADLGVMISASHNPYHDNGIKLFGPDGYKLSDDVELEIERKMDNGLQDHLAPPDDTGRARRLEDVSGRYTEFIKGSFPAGLTLEGLKVVVDCANGAAYKAGPTVLWELGADVIPVAVSPNGCNINNGCGSTYPEYLQEQVIKHGADVGLAFDGDADRVVMADEKGQIVNGDQIIGFLASQYAREGQLKGGAIATTVMSNIGLEKYLSQFDIGVKRTRVGDRYVVEEMRQSGLNLGGEESGHIVLSDYGTTGDGILAGLQMLRFLVLSDRPASELFHVFEPVPQIKRNARYRNGDPLANPQVMSRLKEAEARLGSAGRILVRKSGTEPVIRVMAEGEDALLIEDIVADVCRTLEEAA